MAWNGDSSDVPSSSAAAETAAVCSSTRSSGASDSRPATGSGSSARMPRSRTTTIPPPSSARRCTARAMSPSSTPTQTMLWASCAIVGRDGAVPQAEPAHEPEADPAGAEVPLDDGDLGQVALGVGDGRSSRRRSATSVSASVTIWPGTMPMTRAVSPSCHGIRRSPSVIGAIRTVWRTHSGTGAGAISPGGRPAVRTMSGTNRSRSGRTSRSARWAGATAPRPARPCHVAAFRVAIDERIGRVDALGDRVADERVHVPVGGDVLRVAVVRAERDPVRAELPRQRDQRVQVAGARRLADQEPHAGPQPLAALLDRRRLVVGADAGRGVGLERRPAHPGSVAVGPLGAGQRELRELGRVAGDHAGEVHHLGQPDHPPAPQEPLEVALVQRPAGRLELRRRHA